MSSNKYNINFKTLVIWLLPSVLRKPRVIALAMNFIGGIVKIYNSLMAFRVSMLYKLTISPQVCFLEKALNDRYDDLLRRITISDPKQYDYLYVYRKSENKPQYIYKRSESKPVWLYTRAETARFQVDFLILIPVAVLFNANELKALVDSYKLASKKFKVKIV